MIWYMKELAWTEQILKTSRIFKFEKRGLLEALVWFERFLAPTKVRWQSCLWALKLMTSQTVQGRGSAPRHHTVRHRPCWSLQCAERVSNMNLVYGLALREFSVAQVDRAPPHPGVWAFIGSNPVGDSDFFTTFVSPRLKFTIFHSFNVGSCWRTMLRPFARGLSENLSVTTFTYQVSAP